MHEEMRALLNPYLDGELQGRRLMELELHLASCKSCQDELKELRLVSDLIQSAPTPEFMPAERFVANLNMRLPRRKLYGLPSKTRSLAWWLVPAGILAAWFFVQTTFSLTNLVTAMQATGMFGQAVTWSGGGGQMAWFSAVSSLFGQTMGGSQDTLSLLNGLNVFGVRFLDGFLWQALIVFLYWIWLAFWWLRNRPQSIQNG